MKAIDVSKMTTQQLWDLADVMGAELSKRLELKRGPVKRATTIRVDSCTAADTGEALIGFDMIGADDCVFAHGHVGMQEAQEMVEHIIKLMRLRPRGRMHS